MNTLDLSFLPGVYQLGKVISEVDGVWLDQHARGGMLTLTLDGKLSLISSPYAEECMPYLGTCEVIGNQMQIRVLISNIPGLEGKTLARTILFLDAECLILEAIRPASTVRSRLTWKKIAYLKGRAHQMVEWVR